MGDQLEGKLFHKSDIRADGSLFTPETVTRLANAEALFFRNELNASSVVLARDARLTGSDILSRTAEILLSVGFDIHIIPVPASTPYFYHTVRRIAGSAGIMITASHNPGSYNGEKLVSPGSFPIADGSGLERIRAYFTEGKAIEKRKPGKVHFPDFRADFIASSYGFLSLNDTFQPSFRFAADFLSGTASDTVAPALSLMNNVRISHFVPDGRFPLGDPNPAKVRLTPEKDEDFILLYDGDGDRADVVMRDGREVPPSVIFSFILPYIAPAGCRAGLDPKASPVIRDYLKLMGYDPVLVPNGHSRIKGMMKDQGLMAATEESGHYYMMIDGIPVENTLIITLAFLMAYEKEKHRLEKLIALSSSFTRIREWTVSFENDEDRKHAIKVLTDEFIGKGFELTDTLENGEALGTSLLMKRDNINWTQVSLRASETEEGLARFEVLSSEAALAEKARDMIMKESSIG
ncbi:MAG: hypothetical protein ACI4NM_08505 [Bullifex sp.]